MWICAHSSLTQSSQLCHHVSSYIKKYKDIYCIYIYYCIHTHYSVYPKYTYQDHFYMPSQIVSTSFDKSHTNHSIRGAPPAEPVGQRWKGATTTLEDFGGNVAIKMLLYPMNILFHPFFLGNLGRSRQLPLFYSWNMGPYRTETQTPQTIVNMAFQNGKMTLSDFGSAIVK